jgi:glucose-1-phosphate thymidylyltransferase
MMTQPAPQQSGKFRKGILLAGGSGTRLHPLTLSVNKHLLPIYDKPLIYYPLTTLMLAGVSEILIISAPKDIPLLKASLGDGSKWGLSISYAGQAAPNGIAEGLLIGADFINGDPFALILGDNIFYGRTFSSILLEAAQMAADRAVVFSYSVADPTAYGVIEVDAEGRPTALTEKPPRPLSNRAVTGLYFYDARAVEFARSLRPSKRNELEITDLNRVYLQERQLHAIHLGRGFVWFDAGTTHNLLLASQFVEILQSRQQTGIAFPEEVAYRMEFINFDAFAALVKDMPKCAYSDYLDRLRREILEGLA